MPLERVATLDHPPVAGRRYLVPCARVRRTFARNFNGMPRSVWWPLLVPFHADPELLLGNNEHHAHYDPRFLSDAQIAALAIERLDLTTKPLLGVFHYVLLVGAMREVRLLPRLCRRELPPHPLPNHLRAKLRASHRPLPACLKCPHRGLNLRQVPVRGGRIVCPGHGLVWDAATGEPITEFPR